MKLFIFAIALLGMGAFPTSAADLFVKRHPSATPAPAQTDQQNEAVSQAPAATPVPIPVPHVPQEVPAAPVPAPAVPQTAPVETIASFSQRYYQNCMAKQDATLKGANQQMLCACSSQKLTERMSVDDVKTMMTDTPQGLAQRNRMLLEVYAPCMQYPAKALLLENCNSDPNVTAKIPNHEAVCGCMAEKMGDYIAKNGPAAIASSLQADPTNVNPLQALMNSPGFQSQAQTQLMACLTAAQ